jgi:oligosaccharide amylase
MLVAFDRNYQIRDLCYPYVGQENHAAGGECRFGVYADGIDGAGGRLVWSTDKGWTTRLRYLRETLTTSVSMDHQEIQLALYCNDVVDFHRPVLVRRVKVRNLADRARRVKVFLHQDFYMYGTRLGDTAYFDPELQSVIHYRKNRYLMASVFRGNAQVMDEYATGTSGFGGAEGTWRDAEDGKLQGNAVAQGAVDSTIGVSVDLEPYEEQEFHYVLGAGESRADLIEIHRFLFRETPQGVIDRTTAYWRLWVSGTNLNYGNLSPKVVDLFKRSLLLIRTQVDNHGAVLAANDSDIMQMSRDTYSYMWPRDGALVANALDAAGLPDLARTFYQFCEKIITDEGYFLHKYNPDGSPASSWHPWVANGKEQLPIQEDETALVVWALWRHFCRYRDIEFVRPMWISVIRQAADFMVSFRDPKTGLPLPSYDLWEERHGIHAFTVATVYGGLTAAHHFALCFGDQARAELYKKAAAEIRTAAAEHLYSEKLGRFVRRIVPDEDGGFTVDEVVDSALHAIYRFGLFDPEDPRVIATMRAVAERLWVKTRVGGVARYEVDHYHSVSNDRASVPGNPWFICTIWLADYIIERANSISALKEATPIFEWVVGHALESGVLAEQVHPDTNAPLSVSPLTWSHAALVSAVVKYLEKLEKLRYCDSCGQALFRTRRQGATHVAQQVVIEDFAARAFEEDETVGCAETASFTRAGKQVEISIHLAECIGCDVCVNHCEPDVLKSVAGKAYVDLDNVEACTVCNDCVKVCPVNVVSVTEREMVAMESVASDGI